MCAILSCGLLFLGYVFGMIDKRKKRALLCLWSSVFLMGICFGVGFLIEKTIQVEETLIGTYQLESVEKVEDVCYLIKQENGNKEYIETKNVETIEDSKCTQPYMQIYQVTQKSSLSPIILGIMYFNLQYGSSTTMRYEIVIPPNTITYIQKASY